MNILMVKHCRQKVKELRADFAQKNRWCSEFAFEAWEAFQGKIYMLGPRPSNHMLNKEQQGIIKYGS